MDDLHVRSTSRVSAECSDIVLRTTETTRLIFRPLLVDNKKQPQAAVKGTFVFQRKSPKTQWNDIPAEPLSSLKKDEAYRLPLSSAETLRFFQEITNLYKLHSKEGIPFGETEFVRATEDLERLATLPSKELQKFLEADQAVGSTLLSRLLDWALNAEDIPRLVRLLTDLGSQGLRKLNTAVSLQSLKTSLQTWENNRSNSDEEYWQKTLTENSFVFEYVFSWPCSIVKDKAYLGGKNISNTGGKIVDFLVKNRITNNAALIEIKTPLTALLGQEYRPGVFIPSVDLVGALSQVLDYKRSLLQDYHALTQGQHTPFETFEPRCVVFVGDASVSLLQVERKKSFELFRNQLSNVLVITFDELFEKMRLLIKTIEATPVNE